jgi:hypothetical protein
MEDAIQKSRKNMKFFEKNGFHKDDEIISMNEAILPTDCMEYRFVYQKPVEKSLELKKNSEEVGYTEFDVMAMMQLVDSLGIF